MNEISDNLFISDAFECSTVNEHVAIIHACKTCHQRGVGYTGNLSPSHPNYLILESGYHLFLNMVDMETELFAKFMHPIMKSALAFIRTHIVYRMVVIHCNQGQSRSPSIGLVYLAQANHIPNTSYKDARDAFTRIYPTYRPGIGIERYMQNLWGSILEL